VLGLPVGALVQDARNKLIHTVNEIFDLSARRPRRCLQLSENLLLAPMSVYVTRNEDEDIKAALFQFISETEVKHLLSHSTQLNSTSMYGRRC